MRNIFCENILNLDQMSFKALAAFFVQRSGTICAFFGILFGREKKLCNFGRVHYGEHSLHVKSF